MTRLTNGSVGGTMAIRARAKRFGELVLTRGGLARLGRLRLRGETLVLAYHNVVPRGERLVGDEALHVPESIFAAQLDLLEELCDVVHLATALDEPAEGSRPRVAITFDDAYCGALTAGAQELERRRLPYTVFVAPAFLGGRAFWWDAFVAEGEACLPQELRTRMLWEYRGQDAAIQDYALRLGRSTRALPQHARCVSESVLLTLVDTGLLHVASHSWSHANLAALQRVELEEELTRPLEWIHERFSPRRAYLAYPYGCSSAAVEHAAERCGYGGALRVEGGWLPRIARQRFALPRLNVSGGLSADGFALRLAGFFCS